MGPCKEATTYLGGEPLECVCTTGHPGLHTAPVPDPTEPLMVCWPTGSETLIRITFTLPLQ